MFTNTNLRQLKIHSKNYELILGGYEDALAKTFLNNKENNYPWLTNVFVELNRCLVKTTNWPLLEQLSIDIYREYETIEQQIQSLDPNNKEFNVKILEAYIVILQKLNIFSKTSYDLIDDEIKILRTLKLRLIDKPLINVLEERIKNSIDAYGVEILTSYLIKLYQNSEINLVFATEIAKALEKFCLDFLRTLNVSQRISLNCVLSHLSSLVSLYCELMRDWNLAIITPNAESYHILLNAIIIVIFENKTLQFEDNSNKLKIHPSRVYEYQQIILNNFIFLHSNGIINIPSKGIWKLCVYYQLPYKKFDEELKQLLKTLALHQFDLFKFILPVIIFNLPTKKYNIAERTIMKIIKQYNSLLDDLPKKLKPILLKIHVILSVLQMTKKSLEIFDIRGDNNINNRLNVLKHLYIFIENVDFSSNDVLQEIVAEAEKLQRHFLNSKEKETLKTFLNKLADFGYQSRSNN